jgi:acyl carrier protein
MFSVAGEHFGSHIVAYERAPVGNTGKHMHGVLALPDNLDEKTVVMAAVPHGSLFDRGQRDSWPLSLTCSPTPGTHDGGTHTTPRTRRARAAEVLVLQSTPDCGMRAPLNVFRCSRGTRRSHRVVLARQHICMPVLPTRRRVQATLDGMSAKNSVVALEAVTQEIIGLVVAEVGTVDVTADAPLQTWGLDSLKVMSLVFKIEERHGILLDEGDADDLRTVGDLAALVLRCIQDQS